MKNKVIYIVLIIILVLVFILFAVTKQSNSEQDESFKIVTSFYPMYIMALNITDGASNVEVENMTNEQVGCIHNYTLKTADLVKMENADVFIKSGLGLEEFSEKILNTYKDINIIDSSISGIEVISNEHKTNPHIWVNVENYTAQVNNIAKELAKIDSANAETYLNNANQYIAKINKTAEELKLDTKIKAVTFNETLSYLQNDNLEIITIEIGHEETALSAQKLSEIIDKMNEENIKIIFVDTSEEVEATQTLANETGAKIYYIDSYLTGENKKDAYLDALTKNIEILNRIGE